MTPEMYSINDYVDSHKYPQNYPEAIPLVWYFNGFVSKWILGIAVSFGLCIDKGSVLTEKTAKMNVKTVSLEQGINQT